MALEEAVLRYTYEAEAAIGQYLIVTHSTTLPRTCKIAGAAEAKILGVTMNKATAAKQALAIAREGIIKVRAGAAVILGATVTSDATGRAVSGAAGFGVAITAAANADEVIEVQWYGPLG